LLDEHKKHTNIWCAEFANKMVLRNQLFQYDGDLSYPSLKALLLLRFYFFIPKERGEKRFVHSKSLPREKQAGAPCNEVKLRDACPRKTIRDEQKKRNLSR